MKSIINGKCYDTSKAHEVGSWDNGLSRRDFKYRGETLYRKRTGEYFLFAEGGGLTEYAHYVGTMREFGQKIIPLAAEQARRWAEERLDADEYEAEFGEIAEDDSRTVLSITMNASLAERLRREAARGEMPLSAYIESKLR